MRGGTWGESTRGRWIGVKNVMILNGQIQLHGQVIGDTTFGRYYLSSPSKMSRKKTICSLSVIKPPKLNVKVVAAKTLLAVSKLTPSCPKHQHLKKHGDVSASIQNWLVVSTHLKNISQNGNLPQIGVKIIDCWNHQLDKLHNKTKPKNEPVRYDFKSMESCN